MTSSCLSRQNGCKIPATAVAVTAVVAVWRGCHVLSLRMWLWRRQGDCHLYQSKPWGIVVIAVAIVICCCWWSLMTVFQSVFLFYPYMYNIHFRTICICINKFLLMSMLSMIIVSCGDVWCWYYCCKCFPYPAPLLSFDIIFFSCLFVFCLLVFCLIACSFFPWLSYLKSLFDLFYHLFLSSISFLFSLSLFFFTFISLRNKSKR